MSFIEPARAGGRRTRLTILVALIVVSAGLIGVLGHESSAVSSALTPALTPAPTPAPPRARSPIAGQPLAHLPNDNRHGDHHSAAGPADGVVPDGVTVFDDRYPAVANLDPALLRALRQAATDAARNGVEFSVDSGWRSRTYQEQLFGQAVAKYGSAKKAARWVAPPGTSAHEAGDAVDIGPSAATAWLSEHGARYGLCQIYRNEPWHYELRPKAVDHGCPAQYADPTHDPRIWS